jgi:glutamyl-tRNA synthetase/glutamyl-Q tRNA(Asp) synthetase
LLHLGHVANAIYVWGLARARGAQVLLRVEDHDATRSRPEFEHALLDDLDWLGIAPDLFPTGEFRAGLCASRQSDRQPLYAEAAARLIDAGVVYACQCSRADLDAGRVADGREKRYPGTCRTRGLPLERGLVWRVRMDDGVVAFDDLLCGPQRQDPAAACGDVAIRDRLGQWTYQFAVVVDDFHQGIDLVVRGMDLLPSTARQIRIAALLGRVAPPVFAHHPLVMKSATQKLSKSDADTGIAELRALGWRPGRVLGEAARRVGLTTAAGDLRWAGAIALVPSTAPR